VNPTHSSIEVFGLFFNIKNTIITENMNNTFEQISVIGFMKHNGGMEFRTVSETDYQFRTTVQDIHLNPGGITHGGFIMSLMDSGMGTAAHRVLAKNARAATISFDVKFISASKTGDVLLGTAKVLRKTRSLVFMQGELRSGEQLIATAEGIWKVL
jgi:uncharacterized protein (TIGR00369 family)